MKKSTMWSLAMALATTMSGGTSITNIDDDDSKPEETVHIKAAPAKFEEEILPTRPFRDAWQDRLPSQG